MNTVSKRTFNLVLAGVMIAMGTALGFVKPFELPYGGAITLCSMLPVMFFSYRCGLKWGLSAGLVFSVLQLLFGLDALKGISAMMVVGSIFLDYILAFTVLGLAGMFRGKIKNDAAAFTLGSFVSMMLRYFCSFLSGWVLWASCWCSLPASRSWTKPRRRAPDACVPTKKPSRKGKAFLLIERPRRLTAGDTVRRKWRPSGRGHPGTPPPR